MSLITFKFRRSTLAYEAPKGLLFAGDASVVQCGAVRLGTIIGYFKIHKWIWLNYTGNY